MTSKTISITAIETRNTDATVRAIQSTLYCVPATKIYWVSNTPPPTTFNVQSIAAPVAAEWIRVREPRETEQFNLWYSDITLRLLPAVVSTDYNVIVQSDGYGVNPEAWTDEFLDYDYIGAPWVWWGPPDEHVGNGGFSLRSRRLYDALLDWKPSYSVDGWPDLDPKYYNPNQRDGLNEDNLLAGPYRKYMEKQYGLRWAPTELAHRWSIECSESWASPWFKKSLGFHGEETAHRYGIILV